MCGDTQTPSPTPDSGGPSEGVWSWWSDVEVGRCCLLLHPSASVCTEAVLQHLHALPQSCRRLPGCFSPKAKCSRLCRSSSPRTVVAGHLVLFAAQLWISFHSSLGLSGSSFQKPLRGVCGEETTSILIAKTNNIVASSSPSRIGNTCGPNRLGRE